MRDCAYCSKPGKMTKEHVFPNFFDKLFPDFCLSFNSGANRWFGTSPKIGDVCDVCNNGVLSHLDNYGKLLANQYFKEFIINKPVTFKYDYNLLLRWVLKISYNGARAFQQSSSEFSPYVPYILGEADEAPLQTVLLGAIMKPSFYLGKVIYPKIISTSVIIVNDESGNLVLARAVIFQSYIFVILGWGNPLQNNRFDKVVDLVFQHLGAIILSPHESSVVLDPLMSKMDYIQHKTIQANINESKNDLSGVQKAFKKANIICIQRMNAYNNKFSKVALVTMKSPNIAIASIENYHPLLVMGNYLLEQGISIDDIIGNSRAGAYVVRKGSKTYIKVLDYYELDIPFCDVCGIYQSEKNWRYWKEAILFNNNYLVLAQFLTKIEQKTIKAICKIKVNSIVEE